MESLYGAKLDRDVFSPTKRIRAFLLVSVSTLCSAMEEAELLQDLRKGGELNRTEL